MIEYSKLVEKVSIPADKKIKQKDYLERGKIPVIDQGRVLIGGYSNEINKKMDCSLPVIVFGDHTRIVKHISFPFCAGADGIKVLRPKDGVLSRFLFYGTQYIVSKMPDRGYARHYQYVEKEKLYVPSISEQEHIVARIEELLSKLDTGVETLNKTKAQLAVYRQAVITEAYHQRKEVCFVRLDEIAEITGGITKGRDLSNTKTIKLPYLRVANVQNGYLDLKEIKKIELRFDEKEKYILKYGDVLYTEGGDRDKLGRGTIWKNEIPECVHQNHVFKARIDLQRAIPEYVAYWSMSRLARNYFYQKGKQSVNLASINKTVLSALVIPLPDLDKQHQIVKQIESSLSVCDDIEKTIDATLQQATAMRQSVLKLAFEGKL